MKKLIRIPRDAKLPLLGLVQVGCIDRGTNLIQVRATTRCPLNCIFCSTDAGANSRTKVTEYIMSLDYLVDGLKDIVMFKDSHKLEMHIDSVGEPTTYPKLIELVQSLSEIKGVDVVSMQTNGVLLSEDMVDELEAAGLSRINLSLNAMKPEKAKMLSGREWYDVTRIIELAKYIADSKIELLLAPVWIPGINDEEVLRIIEFAKAINKNKKWPCLGIQKYEVHKYGRKIKGVKPLSWWKFYKHLEEWEKNFKIKLKTGPSDFGIYKVKRLPYIFKKGEKVRVKLVAPGWMANEMIGVAENRCITVVGCDNMIGETVTARIIRNKDNIYMARIG